MPFAEPVPRSRSFIKSSSTKRANPKAATFQRVIQVAGIGAQAANGPRMRDFNNIEDEDAITVNEDFEAIGEGEWLVVERSHGR